MNKIRNNKQCTEVLSFVICVERNPTYVHPRLILSIPHTFIKYSPQKYSRSATHHVK